MAYRATAIRGRWAQDVAEGAGLDAIKINLALDEGLNIPLPNLPPEGAGTSLSPFAGLTGVGISVEQHEPGVKSRMFLQMWSIPSHLLFLRVTALRQ